MNQLQILELFAANNVTITAKDAAWLSLQAADHEGEGFGSAVEYVNEACRMAGICQEDFPLSQMVY